MLKAFGNIENVHRMYKHIETKPYAVKTKDQVIHLCLIDVTQRLCQ